jgi:hypothetical protein
VTTRTQFGTIDIHTIYLIIAPYIKRHMVLFVEEHLLNFEYKTSYAKFEKISEGEKG